MSKTRTKSWEAAALLQTGADMVAYLEAVYEANDRALIAAALEDVARAFERCKGKIACLNEG